jgi:2,3-diketo-5-methylthio-1-phosphopentane phosphatase
MALKVFVDFDGTITKLDVGNAFFRKYVGREQYDGMLREYKEERISAAECFRRGIAAVGSVNRNEVARFVRGCEIDPSFKDFILFCKNREIDFHVVSDGLDFYIKEIFAANGIQGVSVFSNVLELLPADNHGESGLRVSFPYMDAECRRCACCKRNIMVTQTGDQDIIVYVGEGYSDQCPVQYADIVFAKDALQAFCQRENISYSLYGSFKDVVDRLDGVHAKKRLHKRLAADMKRKAVFMREP